MQQHTSISVSEAHSLSESLWGRNPPIRINRSPSPWLSGCVMSGSIHPCIHGATTPNNSVLLYAECRNDIPCQAARGE